MNAAAGPACQLSDLRVGITAGGGRLPMAMVGFILQALGTAYPNMQLAATSNPGEVLSLHIPAGDYLEPVEVDGSTLAALAPGKEDPEMAVFTRGLVDGAVGMSPPPWLATLLVHAAESLNQVVEASGAPNYLTYEVLNPDGGPPFTWAICRPGCPNPHELRQIAEARVEQLEQQLRGHGIKPTRRPPGTTPARRRSRATPADRHRDQHEPATSSNSRSGRRAARAGQ